MSEANKDESAPSPPVDQWLQHLHEWYPRLHHQTYFLPPLPFRKVPHEEQFIANQSVLVPQEVQNAEKKRVQKNARGKSIETPEPQPVACSMWPSTPAVSPKLLHVNKSDVSDDVAHERVLNYLHNVADARQEVMFVISQLDFSNYLTKSNTDSLPTPSTLEEEKYRRGDFDVLIVHSRLGVIVGEIKSVGWSPQHVQSENSDFTSDDAAIARKVLQGLKQLDKAQVVLDHLLSDLKVKVAVPIRITRVLMLPCLTSDSLLRAARSNPDLNEVRTENNN